MGVRQIRIATGQDFKVLKRCYAKPGEVVLPPGSMKKSNFFAFQSYELRFSEIFFRYLKHPFPGYFPYPASLEGGMIFSPRKVQNLRSNFENFGL